jgi:hypothetical protein
LHIRVQLLTQTYPGDRQILSDRLERVRTLLALARLDTLLAGQGATLA